MKSNILECIKTACQWTIAQAYKKTTHYDKDTLDRIFLTAPRMYKPSVEDRLLLKWQNVFTIEKFDYFPIDLEDAILATVVREESEVRGFNFGRIQSMTDSKGFGIGHTAKVNGSWFKNACDWGRAMYPFDTLSGLDEDDFKANIHYTENTEGFLLRKEMNVHHLAWLDRYVGQQRGGSHHAAMLIHQINNQNREYTRDITLTSFSLNTNPLQALSEHYYMFVTSEEGYCSVYSNSESQVRHIFREYVCEKIYTILEVDCCKKPVEFIFIKKTDLKINRKVFDIWYKKQIKRGVIIDLLSLLSDAYTYCNEPYLHECKSITLGDYFRTNDLLVKEQMSTSK
ncbi:hypothetical protein WNY51_18410 [Pseudocolwellia sp. AS88]|uniref:hypothetical protein n=1 Tax=Pseudocolwellia sp. AS88 TaxID=3063958 RepID=UPI0026E9FB48|nr:hypothetical protein [Pseudocolwellia sp. AS88]MDO7085555.1 hypothetical protein [Pseudocolwellia sp. AS88]